MQRYEKNLDYANLIAFFSLFWLPLATQIYFLFSIISKGLWLVWFFHCKRVSSIFLFNIFPNELSAHYYTFPNEYSIFQSTFQNEKSCKYTKKV